VDTVYIETSIVSYLRQKPSSQVVAAARQILTHRWWSQHRLNYELVASQYVIDEASSGDTLLAKERLESLDGVPLLPITPEVPQIAQSIMALGVLPQKAQLDEFFGFVSTDSNLKTRTKQNTHDSIFVVLF